MEQINDCFCVELFCIAPHYELIKACDCSDVEGTHITTTCLDCGGEAFEYPTITTDETINEVIYRTKREKTVVSLTYS